VNTALITLTAAPALSPKGLPMLTLLAAVEAEAIMAIAAILIIAFVALVLVVKNVLYVCQPNEVLIFSGRRRTTQEGKVRGYRIIRGGRALRVPLFETVDRMDLTNMIIELQVRNAYSKGGIPLSVHGIANIKIPGEEPLLSNTLERFLGKSRAEIMRIARDTLEGNLRGVLSTLTPEQVNQDKENFARQLAHEAEHDLHNLGLVLDTLKIQNVTDEVGYLDAIGRMRSAHVRRDALIAEAKAQAESAEQRWMNTMRSELAKIQAQIDIARKENERRITDAKTQRGARIAKERADVQALVSHARADLVTQGARIEQVRLQLQADVLKPAEADRRRAEEAAKGQAAQIVEQGRATAKVLADVGAAYARSGASGRDVLLMQKLMPLVAQVTGTIGELKVDRMTVLASDSQAAGGDLAPKLVSWAEQIRAATGIDITAALREKLGQRPTTPSR
jgi:flotillin